MPFDPSRGSNSGYNGYNNPYAPKQPAQQSKKGTGLIVAVIVGVLVLGLVGGGVIFLNMTKTPVQNPQNQGSAVQDSTYMEVEIYDVEAKTNQ